MAMGSSRGRARLARTRGSRGKRWEGCHASPNNVERGLFFVCNSEQVLCRGVAQLHCLQESCKRLRAKTLEEIDLAIFAGYQERIRHLSI